DPATQNVYEIDTTVVDGVLQVSKDGMNMLLKPKLVNPPDPPGKSPASIVAAYNAVCWVYDDKLGSPEGMVACSNSSQTTAVAIGQQTPRSLALSVDASDNATAVYWANFAK